MSWSKIKEKDQYWIDRKGLIKRYKGENDITALISVHTEIARDYFPDVLYPGDKALEKGWVKVNCTGHRCTYARKFPNNKQLETLSELKIKCYLSYGAGEELRPLKKC